MRRRCVHPITGKVWVPERASAGSSIFGYGFRPAAAAWEKHYSSLLESVGFTRGVTCGVVFYHEERDISLALHVGDFTFCGLEEDLAWIREIMERWFEIKVRAIFGNG